MVKLARTNSRKRDKRQNKRNKRRCWIISKDFGSKVKLSRSQISCYEKGIRDATDRSIKDICREFDINENWLRFGEGEKHSINKKIHC
ncbi:helix-turn-helix domain-containing protein [Clostridioides difficile]|nr:helix-turn-helix domain-containing protein [Clostridioides difficile]